MDEYSRIAQALIGRLRGGDPFLFLHDFQYGEDSEKEPALQSAMDYLEYELILRIGAGEDADRAELELSTAAMVLMAIHDVSKKPERYDNLSADEDRMVMDILGDTVNTGRLSFPTMEKDDARS